jgi:hypothetical protein
VEVRWARRGLYKFFDLCIEYTQHSKTQNLDKAGSFAGNFSDRFSGQDAFRNNLRSVIFEPVE